MSWLVSNSSPPQKTKVETCKSYNVLLRPKTENLSKSKVNEAACLEEAVLQCEMIFQEKERLKDQLDDVVFQLLEKNKQIEEMWVCRVRDFHMKAYQAWLVLVLFISIFCLLPSYLNQDTVRVTMRSCMKLSPSNHSLVEISWCTFLRAQMLCVLPWLMLACRELQHVALQDKSLKGTVWKSSRGRVCLLCPWVRH